MARNFDMMLITATNWQKCENVLEQNYSKEETEPQQ